MPPGRYALIIGNSEYDDPTLARLSTPLADIQALGAVLRDPEIGNFKEVEVLENEISSRIRREISWFFQRKRREDLLLLYFSGHGVLDTRGRLFLAAGDTEREVLRGTAIPAQFITEEMDDSRSRRKVLILDCCHSGAFARGAKGVPGTSVGTAGIFEGRGFGRVVLTASDATQYAWEGDQITGQGLTSIFTHALIEGMRTGQADLDRDGQITVDELFDFVHTRVLGSTPNQTPEKWAYQQQGKLIIAQNPQAGNLDRADYEERPGPIIHDEVFRDSLGERVRQAVAAVRTAYQENKWLEPAQLELLARPLRRVAPTLTDLRILDELFNTADSAAIFGAAVILQVRRDPNYMPTLLRWVDDDSLRGSANWRVLRAIRDILPGYALQAAEREDLAARLQRAAVQRQTTRGRWFAKGTSLEMIRQICQKAGIPNEDVFSGAQLQAFS